MRFAILPFFLGISNSSSIVETLDFESVYNDLLSQSGIKLTSDEMQSHLQRFYKELQGPISSSYEETFRRSLPALRQSVIDEVNASEGVMWTASPHVQRFNDKPLSFAIRQCGTFLNSAKKSELPVVKHESGDVPKSFDSRKDFGPECSELIGTAQDQSNCGSCWSFSTTTALEDRVCLASKGQNRVRLAPLDTVSCCNVDNGCDSFGCNGGDPASAWSWFVHEGVVTGGDYGDETTCKPYAFPKCAHHVESSEFDPCSAHEEYETPQCVHQCTNSKYTSSYNKDKHRSVSAYSVSPDEKSIKLEIMKNGPVSAAFQVYEDFLAYTGGIYHHVTGQGVGGHAVKLIGWGEENGVKYWLLLNSWNPTWGENGAFRMRINECGILDEITAGKVHDKDEFDNVEQVHVETY
jgi:cathepsin B